MGRRAKTINNYFCEAETAQSNEPAESSLAQTIGGDYATVEGKSWKQFGSESPRGFAIERKPSESLLTSGGAKNLHLWWISLCLRQSLGALCFLRLFSFFSLGHRFHAVAWATTTYHKRFHKSRDYSGLYDFKLITFYVSFSLVLRISFWYVGIVKAVGISAHRLWIESVRTLWPYSLWASPLTRWCFALCFAFAKRSRSNLHSRTWKQAFRYASFDYLQALFI